MKYKKYFYVLRPILACKWIEKKKCPPPVLFQNLVDEVLEEHMKAIVENLVAKKMNMIEAEKGQRIDELNQYISDNLLYFKEKVSSMEDDRRQEWDELNSIFLKLLNDNKEYIEH